MTGLAPKHLYKCQAIILLQLSSLQLPRDSHHRDKLIDHRLGENTATLHRLGQVVHCVWTHLKLQGPSILCRGIYSFLLVNWVTNIQEQKNVTAFYKVIIDRSHSEFKLTHEINNKMELRSLLSHKKPHIFS